MPSIYESAYGEREQARHSTITVARMRAETINPSLQAPVVAKVGSMYFDVVSVIGADGRVVLQLGGVGRKLRDYPQAEPEFPASTEQPW